MFIATDPTSGTVVREVETLTSDQLDEVVQWSWSRPLREERLAAQAEAGSS